MAWLSTSRFASRSTASLLCSGLLVAVFGSVALPGQAQAQVTLEFVPAAMPAEVDALIRQAAQDEQEARIAEARHTELRRSMLITQLNRLLAHYRTVGDKAAVEKTQTVLMHLQAMGGAGQPGGVGLPAGAMPPMVGGLPVAPPPASVPGTVPGGLPDIIPSTIPGTTPPGTVPAGTIPGGNAAGVLPDPGSLTAFRTSVGQTFTFRVTGAQGNTIWGTDTYTDDSPLATAAVHAGVLDVGETGNVTVRIVAGCGQYTGSTKNGITSRDYQAFGGSYQFERPAAAAAALPNLSTFRGRVGMTITLEVVGSTEGTVWGSDIYTDDSSIPAAAVHAGLVKPGERATLVITILPARNTYNSTERNGVTTRPYGVWYGSFMIDRPQPAEPAVDNLRVRLYLNDDATPGAPQVRDFSVNDRR